MQQDVRASVRTCDKCLHNKASNRLSGGLLQSIPIPQQRWKQVTMDLIVQLPKTSRRSKNLVEFVDRLSKQILLAPLTDNTIAPTIARAYSNTVFHHKGLAKVIISDRDPRFTGSFWKTLHNLLNIRLAMSTAFHPQTDGQTERANRTIEDILRAYVSIRQTDWDLLLTPVEFAYNNSVQTSTGHTPFYLGTHIHTPAYTSLLLPIHPPLTHFCRISRRLSLTSRTNWRSRKIDKNNTPTHDAALSTLQSEKKSAYPPQTSPYRSAPKFENSHHTTLAHSQFNKLCPRSLIDYNFPLT